MWSSCACVSTMPRTFALFCRRYEMSGMTRSMPSISSSGNMRPASTTTMSSPCSIASMFLPISPTPPSGITRSLFAKERHLIRGLLLRGGRLSCDRLRREQQRERGEVSRERATQRGLVERGGGMVDGEDQEAVDLALAPVDPGDRLTWQELAHRVTAERHDDARLQQGEMALQPYVAGGYLFGQRVAVLGRAMPHDVGDEHLASVQPDVRQELVEELSCGSDEGPTLEILVVSGRLAKEEDPGVGASLPGHGLPRAPVKGTGRACPDLVREHAQVVLHWQ